MRLSVSLSFASPDWRASFRIAAIVREPEVIAALDKIGAQPASGGTEDLGRAMKEEQQRVAKAVAAAGIKSM